ncbi:MAG: hypothetical protein ACLRIO_01795 [Butyricicoccus sp.]
MIVSTCAVASVSDRRISRAFTSCGETIERGLSRRVAGAGRRSERVRATTAIDHLRYQGQGAGDRPASRPSADRT